MPSPPESPVYRFDRPLEGRRIVITRTREQSSTLAAALAGYGAIVEEIPTIRIEPPSSYAALDLALAALASYDFLILTSANAARILAQRLPVPWASQPRTVAVGPATAQAIRDAGLAVDIEPTPAIAESVVRDLEHLVTGKRVLLVRAEQARDVIPERLRAAGATVDIAVAYRTVVAQDSAVLLFAAFARPETHPVHAVAFTSSSTVTNFFALLGNEAAKRVLSTTVACSIGPVTSATLCDCGIEPAVEALQHDVQGLAAAIAAHFKQMGSH